jgi:hypothetical protein
MHLKSLFVDPAAGFRPVLPELPRFGPNIPVDDVAIAEIGDFPTRFGLVGGKAHSIKIRRSSAI